MGRCSCSVAVILGLLLKYALGSASLSQAAAVVTAKQHTIIIDAGSTGSRAHVFSFTPTASHWSIYPSFTLPPATLKVFPGLSSFHNNVTAIRSYLQPLLQFAQQQVPVSQHSSCEVHLLATAGMRLLPPAAQETVMEAVRQVLAAGPFRFRPQFARVLSGSLEGVYAWVAVNYAAGALQYAEAAAHKPTMPRPPSTGSQEAIPLAGILELGGASLQVTTVLPSHEVQGKQRSLVLVNLPGIHAALYSKSFTGFGIHSARVKAKTLVSPSIADPCSNTGLPGEGKTAGSFTQCQAVAAEVLSSLHCDETKSCATAIPVEPAVVETHSLPSPITGMFYAMETFYFSVVECLGLPKHASLDSIRNAGETFCGLHWDKARASAVGHPTWDGKPVPLDSLETCCFASAYIYTLMVDVLGAGRSPGVDMLFSNSVEDPAGQHKLVSWALGAALMEVVLAANSTAGSSSAGFSSAGSSSAGSSSARSSSAGSSSSGAAGGSGRVVGAGGLRGAGGPGAGPTAMAPGGELLQGWDRNDRPGGSQPAPLQYGVHPFDERTWRQWLPLLPAGGSPWKQPGPARLVDRTPASPAGSLARPTTTTTTNDNLHPASSGTATIAQGSRSVGPGRPHSSIAKQQEQQQQQGVAGGRAAPSLVGAPASGPHNQVMSLRPASPWSGQTHWGAIIVVLATGFVGLVLVVRAAVLSVEPVQPAMKRRKSGDQIEVLVAEPFIMPRTRSRLSMGY